MVRGVQYTLNISQKKVDWSRAPEGSLSISVISGEPLDSACHSRALIYQEGLHYSSYLYTVDPKSQGRHTHRRQDGHKMLRVPCLQSSNPRRLPETLPSAGWFQRFQTSLVTSVRRFETVRRAYNRFKYVLSLPEPIPETLGR